MGPEIFDRCVGGGKPKGSATAANIPADPKTLCFVRRSWTRPLKTINYAVNRLENDGSGMIFLSNEIIRAFVVDRKLVEREEGEEERERERKKKAEALCTDMRAAVPHSRRYSSNGDVAFMWNRRAGGGCGVHLTCNTAFVV